MLTTAEVWEVYTLEKGKVEVSTISLPVHFYVNLLVGISPEENPVHICATPIGNMCHKALGCVRDDHHSAATIFVLPVFPGERHA